MRVCIQYWIVLWGHWVYWWAGREAAEQSGSNTKCFSLLKQKGLFLSVIMTISLLVPGVVLYEANQERNLFCFGFE